MIPQAYTLHRRHDPDTSREAAQAIVDKITVLQWQILAYAHSRPLGFTDLDMQDHFADHSSTLRTRRAELTAQGLIVDSGRRVTLKTRRRAIVWIYKDF